MKANTIVYPSTQSEFEIQAELYCELKKLCDVRGCVRSICVDAGKRHRVWFDLVVFYPDGTPALIIECKNTPHNTSPRLRKGSRQNRRYNLFGVPVIRCGSSKQFDMVLNIAETAMEQWMKDHYH